MHPTAPVLKALRAHLASLRALRAIHVGIANSPYMDLEGENTTVSGSLCAGKPAVGHVHGRVVRTTTHATTQHEVLASLAFDRGDTLAASQSALVAAADDATRTLALLLDAMAQGPVITTTRYRPRITSWISDHHAVWTRVGAYADPNPDRGDGYVDVTHDDRTVEHLVCACAFGTGIDDGPTWRVFFTSQSRRNILDGPIHVDVQATSATRALEWASLLHHNTILSHPDAKPALAILKPITDVESLRNTAMQAYTGTP